MSQDEFNEQYNLAFQDTQLPPATVAQVLKHYVASAGIYGSLLLFLTLNPWFSSLLSISTRGVTAIQVYYCLFAAYLVVAPLVLFAFRPRSLWNSKNLLIVGYFWRVLVWLTGQRSREARGCRPDYKETNALMFLLIKLIYGPLMLYWIIYQLDNIITQRYLLMIQSDWLSRLDVWVLMFFSGIFLLDSTLYFIGYSTEAGVLRNRLRYAETNVFHILVCLACYPPFNLTTTAVIGPSNQDGPILFMNDLHHPVTWVLRGLAALFLLGLISSSLSLFTKASNLTNRGIVTYGPFALVRHPGYICKNLFWLMTILPVFVPNTETHGFSWGAHAMLCITTLAGWLAWASIYFLRAITEERFLSRDPEYREYCQQVKYRFIPWVY